MRRAAALRALRRLCLRAAANMAFFGTSTLMGFCTQTSRSRLDGGNHGERVPMVGRGHQDDIKILSLSIWR